jgi:GABA(A) receptor-associated protein
MSSSQVSQVLSNVSSSEIEKIRVKYPHKVPVYVTKLADSPIPAISKNKFLVPSDITLASFMYVIRKWIKLKPEQAIFFFINGSMPVMSMTMDQLYFQNKSDDGLLRITYAAENTFG